MFRKLMAVLFCALLLWVAVLPTTMPLPGSGLGSSVVIAAAPLEPGKYPVQQAAYDDATGDYRIMLLDTPAGTPPLYQSPNLQLARLTDEQLAAGEGPYLEVVGDRTAMYLPPDFRIEYVHNVTETQTDPKTGKSETVVVRQESSFWTPFTAVLAGQALGSLLFRPMYYVPPVYQSGTVMSGYGGYGRDYDRAVKRYEKRYRAKPAAIKNRQTFRRTGGLNQAARSGLGSKGSTIKNPQTTNKGLKSSGSGVGFNRLKPSNSPKSPQLNRQKSGFGSGFRAPRRRAFRAPSRGFRAPSRGFGGGFRRR